MEEKINNRKVPGFIFSTFLFVFFYIQLSKFWSEFPVKCRNLVDTSMAEDESLVLMLAIAVLGILAACLSLWSIVRMLGGKLDGIVCLRWSLAMEILFTVDWLLKTSGSAVLIYWGFALLPVLKLLFIVGFLVYLAKSKTIRRSYPKSDRRFSPGGWVWLAFLSAGIVTFGLGIYDEAVKSYHTGPINLPEVDFPVGYKCDKWIIFPSDSDAVWADSVWTVTGSDEEEQQVIRWWLIDDSVYCHIWGGTSDKDRRSDFVWLMLQSRPIADSLFVREVTAYDTIMSSGHLYVDQYQYAFDSICTIWTFAVLFDAESYKYCAFSKCSNTHEIYEEQAEAVDFLDKVLFNIKMAE